MDFDTWGSCTWAERNPVQNVMQKSKAVFNAATGKLGPSSRGHQRQSSDPQSFLGSSSGARYDEGQSWDWSGPSGSSSQPSAPRSGRTKRHRPREPQELPSDPYSHDRAYNQEYGSQQLEGTPLNELPAVPFRHSTASTRRDGYLTDRPHARQWTEVSGREKRIEWSDDGFGDLFDKDPVSQMWIRMNDQSAVTHYINHFEGKGKQAAGTGASSAPDPNFTELVNRIAGMGLGADPARSSYSQGGGQGSSSRDKRKQKHGEGEGHR